MNKRPESARWGLPLNLAAVVWLSGCAVHNNSRQLGTAPHPVYDTAEQIQAMPQCKALVLERGPCFVHLRTADGKGFFIGSPGASAEVADFLEKLKDGRTYKFPETFQKYQQATPGSRAVTPEVYYLGIPPEEEYPRTTFQLDDRVPRNKYYRVSRLSHVTKEQYDQDLANGRMQFRERHGEAEFYATEFSGDFEQQPGVRAWVTILERKVYP